MSKKKIKIIGHRGYPLKAPENTLASFDKAVQFGADAIEFDLHISSDGRLVIHHDYALGHPDNGEGNIFQTSFSEINKVDAGKWFNQNFVGERIPTPEQIFERYGDRIEYEIELKGTTLEFITKIIEVVKKFNFVHKVEFTSPHMFLLAKLKQKYPAFKTGVFFQRYPDWMNQEQGEKIITDTLSILPADVAHIPTAILNQNLVNKIHEQAKFVHAADCNDKESIAKIAKLGCDQFSTNNVELAINSVK